MPFNLGIQMEQQQDAPMRTCSASGGWPMPNLSRNLAEHLAVWYTGMVR